MNDFKSLAIKRISNYKSDIIIEGHYHQGKTYNIDNKTYVNIPSLCCDNKYTVFRNEKFEGEPL